MTDTSFTTITKCLAELARVQAQLTAHLDSARNDPAPVIEVAPVPEWQTVKQMAETLGVSPRTVQRRIDEGRLETRDVAGVRMVRFEVGRK